MVVAMIALLVALGGTSFAAVSKLLPANSVGSAQVIDNSLLAKDFKSGQLSGALAFAHVNRDGTLDKPNSKNVKVLSAKTSDNEEHYCLAATGNTRARNVVATLDFSGSAAKQIVVSTNPTFVAQDCPASQGAADAVVVTSIDPPSNPANAFYVVLN
jgi:hypothetical protein